MLCLNRHWAFGDCYQHRSHLKVPLDSAFVLEHSVSKLGKVFKFCCIFNKLKNRQVKLQKSISGTLNLEVIYSQAGPKLGRYLIQDEHIFVFDITENMRLAVDS